jgi:hypothetical protein
MADDDHPVALAWSRASGPYTREHIRRFGQYVLDMNDLPGPRAAAAPLRADRVTTFYTYPELTPCWIKLNLDVVVSPFALAQVGEAKSSWRKGMRQGLLSRRVVGLNKQKFAENSRLGAPLFIRKRVWEGRLEGQCIVFDYSLSRLQRQWTIWTDWLLALALKRRSRTAAYIITSTIFVVSVFVRFSLARWLQGPTFIVFFPGLVLRTVFAGLEYGGCPSSIR